MQSEVIAITDSQSGEAGSKESVHENAFSRKVYSTDSFCPFRSVLSVEKCTGLMAFVLSEMKCTVLIAFVLSVLFFQ